MKTVLVTGATGFVGSHILETFMEQHDIHLIAACRDRGKILPQFSGEVREGNLHDERYLDGLLHEVDVVCHAASWSSLCGHAEEVKTLYYQPTVRLIDKALACYVSRFVNVSSTAAAAPTASADARSRGIPRRFWPHLCTVIAVEDYLRAHADQGCTMVNLRLGDFVGKRYALGLLPILLPRLKTHLVPWVAGGKTKLPLVDGQDIGQAFALAALAPNLSGYESFNIVGPEQPIAREVIEFLHTEFGYPTPHFSVPFPVAYVFAGFMETVHRFLPWDPLVTRSIVHLLEDPHVTNTQAYIRLGYQPRVHWQDAVRAQIKEMAVRQTRPMKMSQPLGNAIAG
ncbi:MAG: NAD-dependent epimerase/dehydratase family protein [Candidatus Binatia bacterium]